MFTSRRSFIKHSVSAASAGLLLQRRGATMAASRLATTLSLTYDIRVLFSGLLVYQFEGNPQYCNVGLLKNADQDHVFSVIVKAKRGNLPPYTLGRIFDIPKREGDRLTLDVKEGSVSKHQDSKAKLDRAKEDNDPMDWRWTLRLGEFPPASNQKPRFENLWPAMRITHGTFYTAMRTDRKRTKIYYVLNGQEAPKDYSIGGMAGADIPIPGGYGSEAVLKTPNGNIVMKKLQDVTYEIYVEYEPRIINQPQDKQWSHFHKYHEAVTDAPSEMPSQIRYEVDQKLVAPPFTPDVPCMGMEG